MNIIAENIETPKFVNLYAIIAKVAIIIVVTIDAKPSTPSVKLIAFAVPIITNTTNTTYNHLGNSKVIFKNGI